MPTRPDFIVYRQRESAGDEGLLGLSPLVRIVQPIPGTANDGLLLPGDLVVQVGDIAYPRYSQFLETVRENPRRTLRIGVLRNGERRLVDCTVNKDGQLQVEISPAHDTLVTAQPILRYSRPAADDPRTIEDVPTPIKPANFLTTGGTEVLAINGRKVNTWTELREQMRAATAAALEQNAPAEIELLIEHPTPQRDRETGRLELSIDEVQELHALGWQPELPSFIFESLQVKLSANGNPMTAISMGFAETHKLVMMTYLTIDRLIRGSVGVDQLRGPVGIIHIGTKVADRGFMYLIFLLGMISVNLAVINFLPLPIVDGGLFLFLIYEKIKGRPPSLAFQNVATIIGLALIGTIFLVTFYNDVLRLIG